MSIKTEVQKLEPDNVVELYVLDASSIGGESLYFHRDTTMGSIWWQNTEYTP
ncbi:minor tail protein [Xanthomonas phage JGB6]|nr:minor tail protein [Xanthomonas phage JGB6]